jgi:hypothetical protein
LAKVWPLNFTHEVSRSYSHGSLTCDRRHYFPYEGSRAADFYFPLKNPSSSAGFESTNLGSSDKHANNYTSGGDEHIVANIDKQTLRRYVKHSKEEKRFVFQKVMDIFGICSVTAQ